MTAFLRPPDLSVYPGGLNRWASLFFAVFLCLILCQTRVQAEIPVLVNSNNDLTKASATIASSQDPQVHHIIFSKYTSVGTLTIPAGNTSQVQSLLFTQDEANPGIIKLDATPLLSVQDFQKPIVFDGVHFELRSPSASLSNVNLVAHPNGSLTFRNCLIFGDNLSNASFLNWVSAPGKGYSISFENCFFGVKNNIGTLTKFNLSADTIRISNCSFNMAGNFIAYANLRFEMSYSTVNRLLFSVDGNAGVTSSIQKNLFAFHGAINPLNNKTLFYPFYNGTGFGNQPEGLASNKRYAGWDGLFPDPSFSDGSGIIPPITGVDTTELWNWYQKGVDYGVGNRPGGPPQFNIFPGTRQARLAILPDTAVTIWFDSQPIPRVLALNTSSKSIPSDSLFNLRYAWPLRSAVGFGPFSVDSIQLVGGKAIHGIPKLITQKSDTGIFFSQPAQGIRLGDRKFFIQDPLGRFYLVGYECTIPRGNAISAPNVSPDSLVLLKVDSAGNGSYSNNAPPDPQQDLTASTRFLGVSMQYISSAILKDSVIYFTKQLPAIQPYLQDSVKWMLKAPGNPLFPILTSTAGWRVVKIPAKDTLRLFMVEHFNVPKGASTLVGKGYSLNVSSVSGFQIIHDTTVGPSQDLFDRLSKTIKYQALGRGLTDQVTLDIVPNGATTAFIQRGTLYDTLPSGQLQPDGKLRLTLSRNDSAATLFLGRRLNIQKSVAFNGAINGVRFSNLISQTSGMLSVTALNESDIHWIPFFETTDLKKAGSSLPKM